MKVEGRGGRVGEKEKRKGGLWGVKGRSWWEGKEGKEGWGYPRFLPGLTPVPATTS